MLALIWLQFVFGHVASLLILALILALIFVLDGAGETESTILWPIAMDNSQENTGPGESQRLFVGVWTKGAMRWMDE